MTELSLYEAAKAVGLSRTVILQAVLSNAIPSVVRRLEHRQYSCGYHVQLDDVKALADKIAEEGKAAVPLLWSYGSKAKQPPRMSADARAEGDARRKLELLREQQLFNQQVGEIWQ